MAKNQVRPPENPTWQQMGFGNIMAYAGGSKNYRTGDWRTDRPVVDKEKCIKCRSCYEICRFDAIAGDAIIIES